MAREQQTGEQPGGRRRAIQNALLLGLIALAVYGGFMWLVHLQGQ